MGEELVEDVKYLEAMAAQGERSITDGSGSKSECFKAVDSVRHNFTLTQGTGAFQQRSEGAIPPQNRHTKPMLGKQMQPAAATRESALARSEGWDPRSQKISCLLHPAQVEIPLTLCTVKQSPPNIGTCLQDSCLQSDDAADIANKSSHLVSD